MMYTTVTSPDINIWTIHSEWLGFWYEAGSGISVVLQHTVSVCEYCLSERLDLEAMVRDVRLNKRITIAYNYGFLIFRLTSNVSIQSCVNILSNCFNLRLIQMFQPNFLQF